MNRISLTVLLGFLPLVFLVEIGDKSNAMIETHLSKKDTIMNTLNGLSSESFPLLESFKGIVNDLPEDKLRDVVKLVDELIVHAKDEEKLLVDRVTNFEKLFRANQTSHNASATDVVKKEKVAKDADDAKVKADDKLVDARALEEELGRLTEIAKSNYETSVVDHRTENMSSIIETLEDVKLIIKGLSLHGEYNATALRLVFTKNHGSSAVCVDNLTLFLDDEKVAFPSTTVTDTGKWSSAYPGSNIISGVSGYYCSMGSSCVQNECSNETVTITMSDPIKFDEYSLTQVDGMGYNPSDFTLQGKETESSEWEVISYVRKFDFPRGGTTEQFKLGTWWNN